jgi:undecaprenyl pyrophosphate phosphatase UppP
MAMPAAAMVPIAAVTIAMARPIAAVMIAAVVVMVTIIVVATVIVMIAHLSQRRGRQADRAGDENRGTDTRYPHLRFP